MKSDSMGSRVLLLVALLGGGGVGLAQSAETVIEPLSGTPFPTSLMPPAAEAAQQLAGTGLRARAVLFISVHVYAFGLYADAEAARTTLSEFSGRSAAQLAGDQRFYRRLLDLEFAMTLRLGMVRTVAGTDVANAFDEALRPRLAAAGASADDEGALRRFRAYFDAPEIKTGTEIVFACSPAGRLSTAIGGAERSPIDSPALCRALFDVYLGLEPISVEGRKTVIGRFPELLAGTAG